MQLLRSAAELGRWPLGVVIWSLGVFGTSLWGSQLRSAPGLSSTLRNGNEEASDWPVLCLWAWALGPLSGPLCLSGGPQEPRQAACIICKSVCSTWSQSLVSPSRALCFFLFFFFLFALLYGDSLV